MSGPLRALATPDGVVCALALDHRDALRNAFRRAGVDGVGEREMLEFKRRAVEALGDRVSAVLLDGGSARVCRPRAASVLVPLEEQGYDPLGGGRLNRLIERFGPREAREIGAAGCKLLLYYRCDHPQTASRQRDLAARAAEACTEHGLPLVVEPLVYRLEGQGEGGFRDAFAELVAGAARDLAGSGADVLKLQFPDSEDAEAACARLSDASAGVPWVLLGGGDVEGEAFARRLETACAGGASGFMAGRVIWGGALPLPPDEQERWLAGEGASLLDRLAAIATGLGRPLAG